MVNPHLELSADGLSTTNSESRNDGEAILHGLVTGIAEKNGWFLCSIQNYE